MLIRHGKTKANSEQRFVGSTDVELCPEGIEGIKSNSYEAVSKVYSSPLKRCIQTAGIIYPAQKPEILKGFREICFGAYEGLTYEEIIQIRGSDGFGKTLEDMVFPEGEDFTEFKARSITAFREVEHEENVAIVTHGGVIMSIMSQLFPEKDYYSYWVDNGKGYKIMKGAQGKSYERI